MFCLGKNRGTKPEPEVFGKTQEPPNPGLATGLVLPPVWYIIQQSKGDRIGVVENRFLDCVGGGQRRVAEFAVHYGLEWPGRLCTTNYYYYYYLPRDLHYYNTCVLCLFFNFLFFIIYFYLLFIFGVVLRCPNEVPLQVSHYNTLSMFIFAIFLGMFLIP